MKYLIDFENVASNGFEGLELLDDGSELLIFGAAQHYQHYGASGAGAKPDSEDVHAD